MGSKNRPGEFDCYTAADPDEPMFVALGRDRRAPGVVRSWARRYWWCKIFPLLVLRDILWEACCERDERLLSKRWRKYHEALTCANDMEAWRLRLDLEEAARAH